MVVRAPELPPECEPLILLASARTGTLALILLLSPSPLSSHTTTTMTRKTPSKKNHRAAQHRRKRLLQLASASAPAAASCEFRSLLAACSALVGDIANWTQWLITLLAATLVDGFWFACEVLMQPPSQVLGFLYQVVSELIFVRDTHSPSASVRSRELPLLTVPSGRVGCRDCSAVAPQCE